MKNATTTNTNYPFSRQSLGKQFNITVKAIDTEGNLYGGVSTTAVSDTTGSVATASDVKTLSTKTQKHKGPNSTLDRKERAKLVQENLARLSDALLNQSKLGD